MSHLSFEELSQFIDKELPNWRMAEIKEHIDNCPACKEKLDTLLLIDQSIRETYKEYNTEKFSAEILERVESKPVRYSFRLKLATIGVAISLAFGITFGFLRSTYRENLEEEKYKLISQHYIISSGDMGIIFISDK